MTAPPADTPPRTDEPTTVRLSERARIKISQNLAAAIAHELRNPVYGITSAAQLLRYRVSDDPLIERNIGRIMREAERLNTLVAALLEFARPAPVRLGPGVPDDVWIDVLQSHRGALESKALLVDHAAAPSADPFNIDVEQLAQAFGNALVNAIEAAPEGSDLRIVSSVTPDGAWESRLQNPGSVIAPDILAGAFEPLVTTKAGHVGIGLAVAQRVMTDHGGSLALESETDSGTTVTFVLPPARGR
ncbi:MAG TPA: ATP-binding protein [Gemmatimonadaceae bacterium]|jgi:signal transduction histidine kinase|nr:ATP-binding protein [Gemmatimonadaceae bacterium]